MPDMLTCRECGKPTPNLPYPANDVDWCNECINRTLDAIEPVPMTEEEIQRIVDYATGKTNVLPSGHLSELAVQLGLIPPHEDD